MPSSLLGLSLWKLGKIEAQLESKSLLKVLTYGAVTTSSGNVFQYFVVVVAVG